MQTYKAILWGSLSFKKKLDIKTGIVTKKEGFNFVQTQKSGQI